MDQNRMIRRPEAWTPNVAGNKTSTGEPGAHPPLPFDTVADSLRTCDVHPGPYMRRGRNVPDRATTLNTGSYAFSSPSLIKEVDRCRGVIIYSAEVFSPERSRSTITHNHLL
jgi:hypothetical protein